MKMKYIYVALCLAMAVTLIVGFIEITDDPTRRLTAAHADCQFREPGHMQDCMSKAGYEYTPVTHGLERQVDQRTSPFTPQAIEEIKKIFACPVQNIECYRKK